MSQDKHLKDRNPITGELPAPELTDEEIAARISEKIAMQRALSESRGTRSGLDPTAKQQSSLDPVDPVQQAVLTAELAEAQAAVAGLAAAEKEAKKAEAEIIARADAERRDRKQALQANAEAIRLRVAEVESRARSKKLEELSHEHAGAAQRNAQRAEAGMEAQRAELQRILGPILEEIKATMAEGQAFMREHGPALERLAAQTFTTSPAEYPIRTRQRLSADCYRPAERLLAYINTVLANATGYGTRWDGVLTQSIAAGKLVSPEGMAATIQYSKACTREHIESWRRTLAQITDRLTALAEQGRAEASAPPQIRITITDDRRHEARREAQYGSLTSSRPTEAVTGPILD